MTEEMRSMLVEGLKNQMEPIITELWKLMASAAKQLEESGMDFDESLQTTLEVMIQGVLELAEETDFESMQEEESN